MLWSTNWWDQKGVIYYKMLQPGQTVISELYQQQLIRVNDTFEEKRPFTGSGRKLVILLQDDIWPHKAKKTLETIV